MEGGFHTRSPLVLASASPRRKRFLSELGIGCEVRPATIDETVRPGEQPDAYVLRLAEEKARALAEHHPDACVLAADTIVVLEGEMLGKPLDASDAEAMLKRMSGRWHEVKTGYCLQRIADQLLLCRVVSTRVLFCEFDELLCRSYVRTGEPLDKAGSYGLQGRGGFLVRRIDGSYSNVIGLPVAEVVEDLLRLGVIAPADDGTGGAGKRG